VLQQTSAASAIITAGALVGGLKVFTSLRKQVKIANALQVPYTQLLTTLDLPDLYMVHGVLQVPDVRALFSEFAHDFLYL
jgi:hypothetical protein